MGWRSTTVDKIYENAKCHNLPPEVVLQILTAKLLMPSTIEHLNFFESKSGEVEIKLIHTVHTCASWLRENEGT